MELTEAAVHEKHLENLEMLSKNLHHIALIRDGLLEDRKKLRHRWETLDTQLGISAIVYLTCRNSNKVTFWRIPIMLANFNKRDESKLIEKIIDKMNKQCYLPSFDSEYYSKLCFGYYDSLVWDENNCENCGGLGFCMTETNHKYEEMNKREEPK